MKPAVRNFCLVLTILYICGTLVGGIGLAVMATHPGRRPISQNEYRAVRSYAQANGMQLSDVSIHSSDNVALSGWFLRPSQPNGYSVILLHGVSDNRLGMYGYGTWLLENHYSVLLPDARAHGLSGGEIATYGLKESDDIHRWVDWIEENVKPKCVFGFGESMGAGQILQSLAVEKRFCSVVAESPFESFREVSYARFGWPFHAGPWLGRTFFWPTDEVGFLFARLRYGVNLDLASPKLAVRKTGIPVFLIHGTSDKSIPFYNSEDIQAANSRGVVVWLVPGAGHCGAYNVNPNEFGRRVLSWLSEHSGAGSDFVRK